MNENIIERARRYLAKLPPAIQGSGGSTATFNAARVIHGFAFTGEPAMRLFKEWNSTHCTPVWEESELLHKLTDAAKRARKPAGHLLKEGTPFPVDEAAKNAAKRRRWPALRRPTPEDLTDIAALRGVSVDAAYLLTLHRHLWRCQDYDGRECFVIRSGTFAQWRRMDGELFTWTDRKDGKEKSAKVKMLPGSEGAFLNPGGMKRPEVPVIITEGSISILEAAEAVRRADINAERISILEAAEAVQRADINTGTLYSVAIPAAVHSVAILAAVSAGSRFTASHLEKLAGRRVRIIPDADPSGQAAAAIWAADLRTAGCTVDCIRLPAGSKDLGDALRAIPATDSFWQQLLTF